MSCGPHDYLEPPQPLPPAGFSIFISSLTASPASSAFFAASSAVSLIASAAFSVFSSATSAACSTAFSALPVLGVPPQALPPAACAAGMVMLPELTNAATPSPARSFFRSLLSIFFLLVELSGHIGKQHDKRHYYKWLLTKLSYFYRCVSQACVEQSQRHLRFPEPSVMSRLKC